MADPRTRRGGGAPPPPEQRVGDCSVRDLPSRAQRYRSL